MPDVTASRIAFDVYVPFEDVPVETLVTCHLVVVGAVPSTIGAQPFKWM